MKAYIKRNVAAAVAKPRSAATVSAPSGNYEKYRMPRTSQQSAPVARPATYFLSGRGKVQLENKIHNEVIRVVDMQGKDNLRGYIKHAVAAALKAKKDEAAYIAGGGKKRLEKHVYRAMERARAANWMEVDTDALRVQHMEKSVKITLLKQGQSDLSQCVESHMHKQNYGPFAHLREQKYYTQHTKGKQVLASFITKGVLKACLLYTSPSPRDS